MLKEIVFTIGLFLMLKGIMVHFARAQTLHIAEKLIKEIKTHKKYKLVNLLAFIDVLLGLLLIWISFAYSY